MGSGLKIDEGSLELLHQDVVGQAQQGNTLVSMICYDICEKCEEICTPQTCAIKNELNAESEMNS